MNDLDHGKGTGSEQAPKSQSQPLCDPNDELLHLNTKATQQIARHPYDARYWLTRARLHAHLGYLELAAGDAVKSMMLSDSIKSILENNVKLKRRLGFAAGFWMITIAEPGGDQDDNSFTRENYQESLAQLEIWKTVSSQAEMVLSKILKPDSDEGLYRPGEYPWMKSEFRNRSEKVLRKINEEFAQSETGPSRPTCAVARFALGDESIQGWDHLGVFAQRDLSEGELVLLDKNPIIGGIWSGPDSKSIKSKADNPARDNLDWVGPKLGKEAARIVLHCRLLDSVISDDCENPLDHRIVARLTPRNSTAVKCFSVRRDIRTVIDVLQQFGIDIFANRNFDTWVLFTIASRIENNSWADVHSHYLNSLFAMFNHDCEPNTQWSQKSNDICGTPDQRPKLVDNTGVLVLRAARDISRGEQLFVAYDPYILDAPLAIRRLRLKRWLHCECSRCIREQIEGERCLAASRGMKEHSWWDPEVAPELPEDRLRRLSEERRFREQ